MSEWMPKKVMCKKCKNLVRGWCREKIYGPDPDLERDCRDFRERTNADRIRAMTDEELMEFFHRQVGCGVDFVPCGVACFGERDCPCYTSEDCKERIAKWLKQPVKED